QKRKPPPKAGRGASRMERRDEELPGLRHGLEREPAERSSVDRNAAPAQDAETFGVGSGFDGEAGIDGRRCRKKCKAKTILLGKVDSLLLRAGLKESLRDRGEQTRSVAASAIGIDAATVGETLQSGERKL